MALEENQQQQQSQQQQNEGAEQETNANNMANGTNVVQKPKNVEKQVSFLFSLQFSTIFYMKKRIIHSIESFSR